MKNNIYNMLKEYGESDYYPFHMPGHKRNAESGPLSSFYQWDITEIDGFDNLHQPEGLILEAQKRAAALFQSEETYFLVNGSTAGILSAISAVSTGKKKIIIARNCHKSVYHGAFLNQLDLEYIYPIIWEEYGILDGINFKENLNNEVAAVVVTSPSYDGMISDVEGIVKVAHEYGIPVIVDQAHGAHFGFHPGFPVNAVVQGADLVIQSVHKTLPAPTQTAVLHCNGDLVDRELLRKYLRIYQSSSPSYLLMAGIDCCIDMLEKEGKQRLEILLTCRQEFWKQTRNLKNIKIMPSMAEQGQNADSLWSLHMSEPGKLIISVKGTGFSGQQLYDILLKQYHLQLEMCGADYVLAILSMMDTMEGFTRLSNALAEIDVMIGDIRDRSAALETGFTAKELLVGPEKILPIYEAFKEPFEEIILEEAVGRAVSDFINLYPPGIPLLVPGESLNKDAIVLIKKYLKNGYNVQGVDKDILSNDIKIKVVKTS